jgi:lipid-A-disaccharide synthase-like uncharacterized protein
MGYLAHLYMLALQHPYDVVWASIGYAGQIVFGIRFLIQWLRSEQEGHSVVPLAFWYCSVIGGLVSLTYTVHMQAWPLVIGQALPVPIYVRNLYLIYRDRRREAGRSAL